MLQRSRDETATNEAAETALPEPGAGPGGTDRRPEVVRARGRVVALDAFRGLMIAGMILVNDQGNGSHVLPGLAHAPWNGVTVADIVFPGFLVAMGAAMAVGSRRPTWPRILRRSALLFALGFALNALPHLDVTEVHIMGVLQRIGLCYLLTSVLLAALPRARQQLAFAAVVLTGYWLLFAFGWPVHVGAAATPADGGLVGTIDRAVLGVRHVYGNGPVDPEGLVSTLPAVVTVLIGYWAGRLLRSRGGVPVVRLLAWSGTSLLVVGLAWSPLFPPNKRLWTSSYTLITAGLAVLLLAGLQAIATRAQDHDPDGRRPWFRRLAALGANGLPLFLLSEKVGDWLGDWHIADQTARTWLWQHLFASWAGLMLGSLLYALALLGCYWVLATILDRRRIYVRL